MKLKEFLKKANLGGKAKLVWYYFVIWLKMGKNAFMVYLNQKKILAIFLIGKIIRFVLFLTFLYFLVSGAGDLAGYTSDEVIFFFLSFNLVDVVSQFLFREVYRFRTMVVSGDLDLVLVKPLNPLFRILFGGADIIDFITIPPLVAATFYYGARLNPGFLEVVFYLALLVNSLLISAAFYIAVISAAIVTYEVDHTVMIFRDLSRLGTVPVDIYKDPLRFVITYIIPIGIMLSFPAKAFLGVWGIKLILVSFLFGAFSLFFSLRFWEYAIRKYISASS